MDLDRLTTRLNPLVAWVLRLLPPESTVFRKVIERTFRRLPGLGRQFDFLRVELDAKMARWKEQEGR